MKHRMFFFQLDEEWNCIHVPERPNGFAIFVIGDSHHFVEKDNSFWNQNKGKEKWLKSFLDAGYTIYYSNLYGAHWGNQHAISYAKRLYHLVMKKEILNDKVHILAEGMGALVALKLVAEGEDWIRSVIMSNPCLSVSAFLQQEKENKFFYKKITKQLAKAYQIPEKQVEASILTLKQTILENINVPIKIWISTSGNPYKKQNNILKEIHDKIMPTYYVPEKQSQLPISMTAFYQQNETFL